MADQISNDVFEMISDPSGINLSLKENPRLFNKVLLQDSILNFYPWGDVYLSDKASVLLSVYNFIEGMILKTKFGRPEETLNDGSSVGGYLMHDYAWSEDQVNSTIRDSDFISGVNCFRVISNYFFKDNIKAKAYKGQVSDAVSEIVRDVYGISDQSKIYIDITTNDINNIWNQGSRLNKNFIKETLARNAYASSIQGAETVPFCSFINCNGEFYFKSLASLYAQTPVASYEVTLAMDKVTNPLAIQEITFAAGGAPTNKDLYVISAYSVDQTGKVINESISLKDKYFKMRSSSSTNAGSNSGNNLGKYPVNINNTNQTNSIFNFGLKEKGDEELLKARQTSLYFNSAIAFRLDVVIRQNAKVKTGSVINLKVQKFTNNDGKEYSSELSGNWLVMASQYQMDINHIIYAHHTLCRPSIPFDNQYKYSGVIIS